MRIEKLKQSFENYDMKLLEDIIRNNKSIMHVLREIENLNLSNWALAGGGVRCAVWNHFHRYREVENIKDWDIIYFDSTKSVITTKELFGISVEFRNQVYIHEWYNREYSCNLEPFTSLEQTTAFWSEVATCVSVYLRDGKLCVIAPYGVHELVNEICSRNMYRDSILNVDNLKYIQRVQKLDIKNKYPRVSIIKD